MPMDKFGRIVEQLKPHKDWIEMISLHGRGEPLLDDFEESKVGLLKTIGIKKILISTNGSLLTKERARGLFENGLDMLQISIDSVKKSTYEAIRRGLSFETVIENVETAIAIRDALFPNVIIRIKAVTMPINENEKNMWTNFWKRRLGPNDVFKFMPYSSQTARDRNRADERKYPCISPFSTMVIQYNGNVHLCCEDFWGDCVLGNVDEKSLKEIWNCSRFEKIMALHLDYSWDRLSLCKNCTVWEEE